MELILFIASLWVLLWLFYLVRYSPTQDVLHSYNEYDNSNTTRYNIPDANPVIINKKDCSRGDLTCQLQPNALEESCINCKQLNATCVHFDSDVVAEIDGEFFNIQANREGEGYCMVNYSQPTHECTAWGDWVLSKVTEDSFAWICRCKAPNLFTQETIFGDCTIPQICRNGELSGQDAGIESELRCNCNEGFVSMGQYECRMKLALDGVFHDENFNVISEDEYFAYMLSSDFDNDWWITDVPQRFGLTNNIRVVNPFFLHLNSSKHALNPFGYMNLVTQALRTYRYPRFSQHLFNGDESIYMTDTFRTEAPQANGYFEQCNGTWFFSKLVIDPHKSDRWTSLPWGYVFGHYTDEFDHSRANGYVDKAAHDHMSCRYSFIENDPQKDVFHGQLGAIRFYNTWIFAPYINPLMPYMNELFYKNDIVRCVDFTIRKVPGLITSGTINGWEIRNDFCGFPFVATTDGDIITRSDDHLFAYLPMTRLLISRYEYPLDYYATYYQLPQNIPQQIDGYTNMTILYLDTRTLVAYAADGTAQNSDFQERFLNYCYSNHTFMSRFKFDLVGDYINAKAGEPGREEDYMKYHTQLADKHTATPMRFQCNAYIMPSPQRWNEQDFSNFTIAVYPLLHDFTQHVCAMPAEFLDEPRNFASERIYEPWSIANRITTKKKHWTYMGMYRPQEQYEPATKRARITELN